MAEEGVESPRTTYSQLVSEIDANPFSQEVWDKVIELVRSEEGIDRATKGFYGQIPLEELIATGERLREAKTTEEKYRILAEGSSTGLLWYDIVLGHVNEKSLRFVGQEFGRRRWKKALDVGTGTGNSLRELKRYAAKVVGVDKSKFLLDVARTSGLEKEDLVTANALRLPFKDGSFDLVISAGMTYYIKKIHLPVFVGEVSRVLEPGGSYFESFLYGPTPGGLPLVEQEYLTSAKAMFVCLMDRLVTHRPQEPGQSDVLIIAGEFQRRGFETVFYDHKDKGVIVLELRKPR